MTTVLPVDGHPHWLPRSLSSGGTVLFVFWRQSRGATTTLRTRE